ncbi:unnamed protein product [Symbiodinium necroappetens]|uniref:Uncharacterized protein n=1 Tax=Symbiodinium necroappetens TaxID=1628268 RepID=A0A812ZXN2_9DINO|nr:unnamed protein product [Symbiodinium necroappetens]
MYLGSEAPNSTVKSSRMFKVLKEICDDKERVKEHDMEVHVSGRVRSQGSAEALQENLGNFVEDLSATASQLGNDMKLKMPKKKKVLSEEDLVNKQVVALFKRLLADDSKIAAQLLDLQKVDYSSELAETLRKHKVNLKTIVANFDATTKAVEDVASKKKAMEDVSEGTKVIYRDVKEAARRIKAAGLKPTKGLESQTEAETRTGWIRAEREGEERGTLNTKPLTQSPLIYKPKAYII